MSHCVHLYYTMMSGTKNTNVCMYLQVSCVVWMHVSDIHASPSSQLFTCTHTHTNTHMHPVIPFKQWLMALCNECKGCIVHFNSVHILVSGPGASKTANARLSFPPPLQRQQKSERKRKRAKMMWLPSTYSHRINTQLQYQGTTDFNAINVISL